MQQDDYLQAGGQLDAEMTREFDERNMGERLATRNLFADLRDLGQMGGGQAAYAEKDRQAFANALDRILTRLMR